VVYKDFVKIFQLMFSPKQSMSRQLYSHFTNGAEAQTTSELLQLTYLARASPLIRTHLLVTRVRAFPQHYPDAWNKTALKVKEKVIPMEASHTILLSKNPSQV
jgi:hypothetical protein